jgi:hypothetical protein
MRTMSNDRRTTKRGPQTRRGSVTFRTNPVNAPTRPNQPRQTCTQQSCIKTKSYTSLARIGQSGGAISHVPSRRITNTRSSILPRITVQ